MSCTLCGSKKIWFHANTSKGNPRYICGNSNCRKTYTEILDDDKKDYPKCPYCTESPSRIKENGIRNKKQRYYCYLCKRSFMLESDYKSIKNIDKKIELRIIKNWLTTDMSDNAFVNSFHIPVTLYVLRKTLAKHYSDEYEQANKNLKTLKNHIREKNKKGKEVRK